ncbi:MAG: hypothetical protein ABI234_11360 [Ktedonobacteraceae bacterium]
MKNTSQAARRREGDQRATTRREIRRDKDAARAASGTGSPSPSVAPMKGTQQREEHKMRDAKKAEKGSAQA